MSARVVYSSLTPPVKHNLLSDKPHVELLILCSKCECIARHNNALLLNI